jgi:acetyl-CoA carboxylase biotin carboxylase subunit
MFEKILIANRGEIAVRIARTCARLGVKSVAVYSEADEHALHTEIADEAICIGPAPVAESYLRIDKILLVAANTHCDAIHPGYGLLSESAPFIDTVEAAGLKFIGPSASAVALMGDKLEARAFAARAGVPIVPGLDGELHSDEEALQFAADCGYPVLVKAAAGGGGIGMKVARTDKQLIKAVAQCRRRGESAFGSGKLYIERYIENPRHVEIQVLADDHGNAVHLYERECSIQRRHQKVIEEAPSVLMTRFDGLRERMTEAALALVKAAKYTNAGTVEFIVDASGQFHFIEMNTRLQVEHPVTEMITGLDLVEWQLKLAAGEPLSLRQSDIALNGHAIECRLYAENPEQSFLPAPGHIQHYQEPTGEGLRTDSGVKADWNVTPYYDPMMAKLIAHGATRTQATKRMRVGLEQLVISGLTHNAAMHAAVLKSDAFTGGEFHTSWLEQWYTSN